MIFCHHPHAGQETLEIHEETHHYLTRVKRQQINDIIDFRNLEDQNLYQYQIQNIQKKHTTLKLMNKKSPLYSSELGGDLEGSKIHLIWGKISPQIIYKTLPFLNELGLARLTILQTDRTQGNYKIDLEKCQKILINSCQQSGRTDLMPISEEKNLQNFLEKNPHTITLHTSTEKTLKIKSPHISSEMGGNLEGGKFQKRENRQFLIGPEGGFSQAEEKILTNYPIYKLPHPHTLRSETAAIFIASLQINLIHQNT